MRAELSSRRSATRFVGAAVLACALMIGGSLPAAADEAAPAPDPTASAVESPTPSPDPTAAPSLDPTAVPTAQPAAPPDASITPSVPVTRSAPTAVGTAAIEGEVLGNFDPLEGATVTVLDAATGTVLKSVMTTGSSYRIEGLPAGPVKVRATKPGWLPSFANGRTTLATADVFVLEAGTTLTQSWYPVVLYLDLMQEAVVEGQVLSQMDPLTGATVNVLSAATGKVLGSAVSDASGYYRIGMLPRGEVKVRAMKSGYLTSFANDASRPADAKVYLLETGQTLSQSWDPIDLYLDLAPEAVIEGQTLSWMDPLGGITVTVLDATSGKVLGSAVSDANGDYRIGMLPAGTIKVRASRPGYLTSFADGGSTFATARSFDLMAGQTLTQSWDPMTLYLDVAPEAVIEGRVLGDGAPLAGATVTALQADTNAVLGSVITDGDGRYRLGGLPTTDVKLRATKAGWLTSFANGQGTLGTADRLSVMGGSVLTNPLLDLRTEAVITGSVLGINDDASAPWDDPLRGVRVTAYDAVTGAVVRTVLSDEVGSFRLDRLPAGGYVVRASLAGWLTTFANGRSTLATADVVTVAAGETVTLPQELVLWAEAGFEGQLLGWSDPIDGTVTVLDAVTGRVVRSVTTTGTLFRIGGLPPGQYKVRGSSPGWMTRYSNEAVTWEQAPVYDLHAGQHVVQNPDDWALGFYVDLTPESVVTGEVMGFSNNPDHPWDDPLGGVTVTALDPVTRKVLGHTTTDSLGAFRIGMLEEGEVLLRATKAGWVTSFAGPVPVAPWVPNPPTQMTIYEAATIEGQVLGGMDPLGGATVTVLSATTGKVLGSSVADGDGYYRVTGLPPGPVKVRATKLGWYAGFANDKPSVSTADVFTLVEGVTLTQQWDPMVLYLDLRPRS